MAQERKRDQQQCKKGSVYHFCLAGHTVSNDRALIRRLKAHHRVSVLKPGRLLLHNALLPTADVLVLDCSASHKQWLELLPLLKRRFPGLSIILVDGGLSQKEIATAFSKGVRDYFSEPYDSTLLGERLQFLGKETRACTSRYIQDANAPAHAN